MSRLENAKRRLREAADAAEPERHLRAITDRTPVTAFALGVAVGLALVALPAVRRGLLRGMPAPPEAAPPALPRVRPAAPRRTPRR